MYSTCLFCNQDLGRNASVEHFPVGRRLAYDAAKGRLWVVCRKCERWNLTPLEERWEAIEECERLFERTRLRVATDNIGLAKVGDGLELVRIGAPLRPEFAAWRYGDQFGRRRRRQIMLVGAGIAGVGALVAGGVAAGVGIGGFAFVIQRAVRNMLHGSPNAEVARLPNVDPRNPLRIRRKHLSMTTLGVGGDGRIALSLRHEEGRVVLEGQAAERATAILMPTVNRFGGTRAVVAEAVREIEGEGSADAFLARIARVGRVTSRVAPDMPMQRWAGRGEPSGLFAIHEPLRLALEMALHEESERRALQGELAELEAAWKQAEEIAAIADDLLVPAEIEERVRRDRTR